MKLLFNQMILTEVFVSLRINHTFMTPIFQRQLQLVVVLMLLDYYNFISRIYPYAPFF
ncbi:MAG: hypothetical protein ACE3JK_15245 [Sporolactobacillus sp.]